MKYINLVRVAPITPENKKIISSVRDLSIQGGVKGVPGFPDCALKMVRFPDFEI